MIRVVNTLSRYGAIDRLAAFHHDQVQLLRVSRYVKRRGILLRTLPSPPTIYSLCTLHLHGLMRRKGAETYLCE